MVAGDSWRGRSVLAVGHLAARLAASERAHQNAAFERSGILTRGRHTYGEPRVLVWRPVEEVLLEGGRVVIGSYCSIADGVVIFTGGNHRTEWVSTFPFRLRFGLDGAATDGAQVTRGDVRIGHDVWIGRDAVIMSGVTIGSGAVIGTRCVVTKDVRPYAIVGGNPGHEIRRRWDDQTISRLLEIAWWDWPEAEVIDAVPLLTAGDVEAFIERAALRLT